MKKTVALILCLILTVSIMCACTDSTQFSNSEKLSKDYTRSTDPTESYNYNDGATSAPTIYNAYANNIINFELRLFRNYYSQKSDNDNSFVISPIGTALQLGLIANGASGDTKSEIISAIGKDLTIENINQCSSYFKSRMEAVSKMQSNEVDELSGKKQEVSEDEYVKFDNNLFFNDISDVRTKFLQTNANYYGSDIFRFMFSDENALTKLNGHFSDFTKNNAVAEIDKEQTLMSVTAADISDIWLDPYAEADIEKGSFTSNGKNREVNYMTSNESFIKTDKAQGIIKYTSANPLKFMIVMPNENISLEDYITDFNNLEFSNLIDSVDITKKATAKIPEFSIDSEKNAHPLSSALAKSGLYTLFTEDSAFTDLTHTDNFMLNEMYEISPKISVNAAGISGTKSNSGSAPVKERIKGLEKTDLTIEFNRPFIFLIIDNESNIPIYIGTVNN